MNRIGQGLDVPFFRLVRNTHGAVNNQAAVIPEDVDQFLHLVLYLLRSSRNHKRSRHISADHCRCSRDARPEFSYCKSVRIRQHLVEFVLFDILCLDPLKRHVIGEIPAGLLELLQSQDLQRTCRRQGGNA
jgi:hypothetical protein